MLFCMQQLCFYLLHGTPNIKLYWNQESAAEEAGPQEGHQNFKKGVINSEKHWYVCIMYVYKPSLSSLGIAHYWNIWLNASVTVFTWTWVFLLWTISWFRSYSGYDVYMHKDQNGKLKKPIITGTLKFIGVWLWLMLVQINGPSSSHNQTLHSAPKASGI